MSRILAPRAKLCQAERMVTGIRARLLILFAAVAATAAFAQTPAAPTLVAPGNEASRVASTQFQWQAVSGATSYHIQVSTAYNFGSPLINDSSLTDTSMTSPTLPQRTVFFWRVRAKNGSGAGSWSAIRTFTSVVPLPAPDSAGWIRLFRGDNAADFFIANNGSTPPGRVLTTFPNNTYQVTGDTIRVSGSPAGQVYFKQPFSHYKVRYQMRFPNFSGSGNTGTGNCGMLLHVQAHDNPTQGFPRSVESQGDPTQGMGQLWPIGDVWVTVKARMVSGRMQYDSTMTTEVDYGGANWNSRVVVGQNGWGQPTFASQQQGGWVTQEAHVYGSDSVIHLVNGAVRIKYRNPRVSSGGTVNNVSKFLNRGLIAWQSEGTSVWYRNIEIQLMPGDSLYESLYTSVAGRAHERARVAAPRAVFDAGMAAPVFTPADGAPGTYDMRGRNLGAPAIRPEPGRLNDKTQQEK